jgi:hypothetical protein
MSASLRQLRFLHRVLRLPALALLLLAVLSNPVLAAVGDLHEAATASADHLHAVQDHADMTTDAADPDEAGDLLHALMHAAHCCGHLVAIPSSFALPAAAPMPHAPPASGVFALHSRTPEMALRPPITA